MKWPTGKWWGPRGAQPIVALHGRQDNAGSFDNLMASLSGEESFLCLDMPGHGLSSHLPMGAFYYVYWDSVLLLRRLSKHFKWTKVSGFVKHSMTVIVSVVRSAHFALHAHQQKKRHNDLFTYFSGKKNKNKKRVKKRRKTKPTFASLIVETSSLSSRY